MSNHKPGVNNYNDFYSESVARKIAGACLLFVIALKVEF